MDINDAASIRDVRMALKDALVPKYGEGEASAMARLTVMSLKGWDLPHLLADEGREAGDYLKGRCKEILDELLNDVPIQYALGETSFYGLKLKVSPGVLIPRPETEELVDMIVRENSNPDLRVLDVGTGSGAIAIALARNLPFSKVTGIDVSQDAVEMAKRNVRDLKTSVEIIKRDIFSYIPEGPFDIIVSNPPYVDESEKDSMEPNVLDYEPHVALFVPDSDPLLFFRRIAEIGLTELAANGKLYFEINPRHSAELKAMLENMGYEEVEIVRDAHGKDRFAKARK